MAGQFGSIVRTATEDGLYLHGYFQPVAGNRRILLHLHGYEGNFYDNEFVQVLADNCQAANVPFISVNTRGNGKDTDFNTTDGRVIRIGAHYENLSAVRLDIDAWIRFLRLQGYEDIYLAGHSLGTVKAVRYLTEGKYADNIKKLLLISPFDEKSSLGVDFPLQKLLSAAQTQISSGHGSDTVSLEFKFPGMSYDTWLSWHAQDEFGRMFDFSTPGYDFPVLHRINIPVCVIVGSKDEYFHLSDPTHPEKALEILKTHIPDCTTHLIPEAPHSYIGFEGQLSSKVIQFLLPPRP